MKTHAILFDNSKYKCDTDSLESIYMVTDYILKPYKGLGVFSFNNFFDVPSPIIGTKCKGKLLKEILKWSEIRRKKILKIKLNSQKIISNELDKPEVINNYKLICGMYTYEMQFYNDISKDSTLTDICYNRIRCNPDNYILAYTNVYK